MTIRWVYRRFGPCDNCQLQDRLSAPEGRDLVGIPPELCPLCQPLLQPTLACPACGKNMGMFGEIRKCPGCGRTERCCSTTPPGPRP